MGEKLTTTKIKGSTIITDSEWAGNILKELLSIENVSKAKKHGFWVCGTHMSNVRNLAMVLLHEYGEEKLAALVNYCKAGCPVENEAATELMIDLIISHTPHIHLNLGESIADRYQKNPEERAGGDNL